MRRTCATALLVAAAVAVAGCGAEDFPNEPRPASTIDLSAKIDDSKVTVAPSEVGAGQATVTISNQSDDEVALDFTGPSDRSTNAIPAGGVASVTLALDEGDYSIEPDVSTIAGDSITVGSARPSSQNDLLLP